MVRKNRKNYYDAIILDINMPIMDGIQACKKINAYLNEDSIQSMIGLNKKQIRNHKS